MAKKEYIALTKMADEDGVIVKPGEKIMLNSALATKFSDLGLLKMIIAPDDPSDSAPSDGAPSDSAPPVAHTAGLNIAGRRPATPEK